MDLAADAREWARWTVKSSEALADPPEVELTFQGTTPAILEPGWMTLEWEGAATTDDKGRSVRTGRLLVAGPEATGSGVELQSGVYTTRLRVVNEPEIIPRDTETITVGS